MWPIDIEWKLVDEKGKTMITGTTATTIAPPSVNGENLEQTKAFKYLGSFITEGGIPENAILDSELQ